MKTARQIIATFDNSGTGAGGFKSGDKCQLGGCGSSGGGGKGSKELTQALHAVQTGKLVKPKRFGKSEISDFSG